MLLTYRILTFHTFRSQGRYEGATPQPNLYENLWGSNIVRHFPLTSKSHNVAKAHFDFDT